MKVWPAKDPDETRRFTYDWGPDLAPGETITQAGVPDVEVVQAAGTTLEAVQHDDTTVTLIVSGGTEGGEAQFLIRPVTSTGQVFEDLVALPIFANVAPEAYPGGYVAPTPGNLVAEFPEFAGVSPTTLQAYLDRTAADVTDAWSDKDYGEARMLLAAHRMTLRGIGDTAMAASIKDGSGEFKSMRIGSLQLDRFDKSSATVKSEWDATRYGSEFRKLLRRNRGGPRVAGYGTPLTFDGAGDNFGPWTA